MLLILAVFVVFTGCKVTAGVYVEKDFQTGDCFKSPDLRTKAKVEMTREFERWPRLTWEEP
jgi:hypothetical protein